MKHFTLRSLTHCFSRAAEDTIVTHDGVEHAGYLAFMGLLALFPFLVFVVAVLGTIGPETQAASLLGGMFAHLPSHVASAIEPRINEITSGPPQGLLTIAIIGAIWTSSSAVEGLRTILNRAYRVHTPPHYVWRRLLSIAQMLLFAFILLVGAVVMIVVPGVLYDAAVAWQWPNLLLEMIAVVRDVLGVAYPLLTLLVVSWMYYAIPNIKQRTASVLPGAALVVLLWMVAATGFRFFMLNYNETLIYGSLGGIISALIFFYICNIIFIFGAEFNYHVSVALGLAHIEREAS